MLCVRVEGESIVAGLPGLALSSRTCSGVMTTKSSEDRGFAVASGVRGRAEAGDGTLCGRVGALLARRWWEQRGHCVTTEDHWCACGRRWRG